MRKLPIILLMSLLVLGNVVPGLTQDECAIVDDAMLDALMESCADIGAGEICSPEGEASSLVDAETLEVNTDMPVVMAAMTAGLPEVAEGKVTMILFGDAVMTNAVVAPDGPPVTLTVRNAAGYPVNMRQGPGTNQAVSGTMERNFEGVVDGRDASGEWFRVQTEDGPQWVYGNLVTIEGDTSTLNVTDSAYSLPMQAFTLVTTDTFESGCDSSGLLIQLAGEDTARMQVNGIDLVFSTATLLVKAAPAEKTEFIVLDGSVDARAVGSTVTAPVGSEIRVVMGGDDDLTAAEGPVLIDSFSFAAVTHVPFAMVSDGLVCVAGVAAGDDGLQSIRTGPSDEFSVLFDPDAATHYRVVGQAEDWWKLDIAGYGQAWVPQEAVLTAGRCGAIEVVEAPVLASPVQQVSSGETFLPAGQSVWFADSGQDVVTGTCSGPPLALCNHPVAISPAGGNQMSWRGQEPLPYTLTQTGPNTYAYNGRSVMGNGNVSFLLTFTSETTWQLTLTTVFDNDPQCNHTFYYNATRSW